jgi:hypothetical protein
MSSVFARHELAEDTERFKHGNVIGHMADSKTRRATEMARKGHRHAPGSLHRRSTASATHEHMTYRKLAAPVGKKHRGHKKPFALGGRRTRRHHRGRRHTRKY